MGSGLLLSIVIDLGDRDLTSKNEGELGLAL